MNAVPNPVDPPLPAGSPPISAAAERARAELHEEIERVRLGVEEILSEQSAPVSADLERELNDLREDTRLYVKKRVRRSEKKVERSIRRIDERTERLERRIDQVEADRAAAEYRIHSETERMLDGLLQEVRAVADLLTSQRRPSREPASRNLRKACRRARVVPEASCTFSPQPSLGRPAAPHEKVKRKGPPGPSPKNAQITRSRCSDPPAPSAESPSGSSTSRPPRARASAPPPRPGRWPAVPRRSC